MIRDAAVQKIICSATMRAFNLDTADGNFDGKISSNVWNDYAKKNGLTEIEENATKDLKSAKEEILQNLCKMHGITQEELEKAQKELQKNRNLSNFPINIGVL